VNLVHVGSRLHFVKFFLEFHLTFFVKSNDSFGSTIIFEVSSSIYCLPSNNSRGHLVTDLLFSLSNLYVILSDTLCLSFEIHQMAAAIIRGKTVADLLHHFSSFPFLNRTHQLFTTFYNTVTICFTKASYQFDHFTPQRFV
jgi:hypothetical protein